MQLNCYPLGWLHPLLSLLSLFFARSSTCPALNMQGRTGIRQRIDGSEVLVEDYELWINWSYLFSNRSYLMQSKIFELLIILQIYSSMCNFGIRFIQVNISIWQKSISNQLFLLFYWPIEAILNKFTSAWTSLNSFQALCFSKKMNKAISPVHFW